MPYSFIKMHGLGNDFVVFDARTTPCDLADEQIRCICDRKHGIGADQLIRLEPPQTPTADIFMRMNNADGSIVRACGNASRCIGALIIAETGKPSVTIETISGLITATQAPANRITVNMGQARLDWQDLPLAQETDTLSLPLTFGSLHSPVAVSMGNPHCIFFANNTEEIDLSILGPQIEHHPLFPERTNVEVAQIVSPHEIRMRVWERGAGITDACGTGACATLVAAVRKDLIPTRAATITQPGGNLDIEWKEDGTVHMTGDWAQSFTGIWPD